VLIWPGFRSPRPFLCAKRYFPVRRTFDSKPKKNTMNTEHFQDVSFKSTADNDVIVTKIINGVLAAKFADTDEFIEFTACDDGWWWAGYSDYSIKIYGDDIRVSKGMEIGGDSVFYKRV
jgi:hypothetical protein